MDAAPGFRESERGIALVIVLWVMTILIVTVLSFSLMTRAEMYGTLAFRERMEKQFLAEAGIERGITEIVYRAVNGNRNVILEGTEVWRTDGTPYRDRMANGSYRVQIYDESGKISLNGMKDNSGIILKNLLINLGETPESADTIVDAILDWKDADKLHRLYGAEDDYYESLPQPYQAKNADFETLEELLLVKGVTAANLYGTGAKKGFIQFLSLYNKTNRIDINAAPREVLAALPGMNAAAADRIVEFRRTAEIKSLALIMDIVGEAYTLMAPHIGVGQTGGKAVCTIEATGYKDLEKQGYPIRATVTMEGAGDYRYLYYRSPAESRP
jgi:general secretion pathway protein K